MRQLTKKYAAPKQFISQQMNSFFHQNIVTSWNFSSLYNPLSFLCPYLNVKKKKKKHQLVNSILPPVYSIVLCNQNWFDTDFITGPDDQTMSYHKKIKNRKKNVGETAHSCTLKITTHPFTGGVGGMLPLIHWEQAKLCSALSCRYLQQTASEWAKTDLHWMKHLPSTFTCNEQAPST